jgi:hypothetical protein
VLTKIKTVDGSGSGLDADLLDGVQGSSFLRSDANDIATGIITKEYGSTPWSHGEATHRPLSGKTYSEAGSVGTTGNSAYTDVYGEADLTGIISNVTFTYAAVWTALEAIGARLPTLAELWDGVGSGSGQSYDDKLLWTCTPAGPHHVFVAIGALDASTKTFGTHYKIVDINDSLEVYRTRGFFDVSRDGRAVHYSHDGELDTANINVVGTVGVGGSTVIDASRNITAGNITTTGYLRGPASFVIDPAAHGNDTGTVVIAGNLQVDGTTTTINSTIMSVNDLNLTLADGAANAAAANGAGITIAGAAATLTYASTGDKFVFNKALTVAAGSSAITFNEYSNGATIWLDGVDGDFSGGDYFNISAYGATDLAFGHGAATKMTLKNTGNVGIGTIAPSTKLEVNGDIGIGRSAGAYTFREVVGGGIRAGMHSNASNELLFKYGADTEAMRINSSGNVGIGTSSPTHKLHVNGTVKVTGTQTFDVASGGGTYISINHSGNESWTWGAQSGSGSDDYLDVGIAGGTRAMSWHEDGNVGIGTTAPTSLLHIQSNDSTTNSEVDMLTLTALSTGTTTTGFGPAIKFQAERNNGVMQNVGKIRSIAEVNSGTNISSGLAFETSTVGALDEKMRITYDGNVGIGTSSPSVPLTVKANSGGNAVRLLGRSSDGYSFLGFRNNADSSNNGEIGISDAKKMLFYTNDSQRMVIDSSGNVGIGTSSPYNKIHVNGTGRINSLLVGDSGATNTPAVALHVKSSAANARIRIEDSDSSNDYWDFYVNQGDGLHFQEDGNTRVTFKTGGNVGIGTSSPDANSQLHIKKTGANAKITLETDESNDCYINFSGATSEMSLGYEPTANAFIIANAADGLTSNERMRIDSSGNVGIGTSSPSERLHVEGSMLLDAYNVGAEEGIFFREGYSNSNKYNMGIMSYAHNGSTSDGITIGAYNGFSVSTGSNSRNERFRIDNGGNVLVGKTTQGLTNAGFEVAQSGQTSITQSGASALRLNRLSSDGELLQFRKDGTTVGVIGVKDTDNLYIEGAAGSTKGLLFNDGAIMPSTGGGTLSDNNTNLGHTAGRFKDLHLSGAAKTDTIANESTGTTTTSTTQTAIATFAKADYDSAKVVISAKSGTDVYSTELLVVHNGTTASATEYGQIGTGADLATFDVDISGSNVRVLATAASSTSTVFKVTKILL